MKWNMVVTLCVEEGVGVKVCDVFMDERGVVDSFSKSSERLDSAESDNETRIENEVLHCLLVGEFSLMDCTSSKGGRTHT